MDLLVEAKNEAARCGLALERDERGLALAGDGMTLRVDFRELIVRLKPGRIQRELLVRAAKTKHARADAPLAVDATAGLGADALLLAAAGAPPRCQRPPARRHRRADEARMRRQHRGA